jgi:deoxyribodipyrimidine photo-lyase
MTETAPVIHWFRRDLRLSDNLALHAALESGAKVIPLFIFDPAILKSPSTGAPRLSFLIKGLQAIDAQLRDYGTRLLIRHGDPVKVLTDLAQETATAAVFANRDYTPFARERDQAVAEALNVPLRSFDDAIVIAPDDMLKPDGTPFLVYSPYMKHWKKQPKPALSEVEARAGQFHDLSGLDTPDIPTLADLGFSETIAVPEASEKEAQYRLKEFINQHIYVYAEERNRLVTDPFADPRPIGPSVLSPYLRLGMLSPRQTYWAAREAYERADHKAGQDSVTKWVDELIWREFYMTILFHFPHAARYNFRREYDALQWRHAPDEFDAWMHGQTGYPVVDAAMRQLNAVGWLPNRARMIVASFLSKDLLIDWREGERYFMQGLIDGDPANNNGGWQWTAGTGTDAQPYFRIFNPVSQSQKFDPEGEYIRRWVPELRDVPARHIHTPWEMDTPPRAYPRRIVEHEMARERTLAAFGAIKKERES